MKQNQKGFTLIELLVVIAIIGLLASVVLLALGSARQKSRDAKRLGDVRQLASAMELYFNDNNSYPTTYASLSPSYIGQMPTFPGPADSCNTTSYVYTRGTGGATYTLRFCISQDTGGYSSGTRTLSETGIQ